MPKQQAPTGLGTKAKKVWKEITETFDLRADELMILEQACRELDLIGRMETEIGKLDTLTVRGSMGQPVISETVKEIRQHRAEYARLIRALKLPDEEEAPKSRSTTAREAAAKRWRVNGSA